MPDLAWLGTAGGAGGKLIDSVDLSPCPDQRVAANQLLAEPGHKSPPFLWREDAVAEKDYNIDFTGKSWAAEKQWLKNKEKQSVAK